MYKLLILLFLIPLTGFSQDDPSIVQTLPQVEKSIGYNKGILRKKLDYQLTSSDQGKFVLKLLTKSDQPLNVKIYDVIGNLILNDRINGNEQDQREYDFTERKTRIFVVKVEAGTNNVIKKVNT